MRQSQRRRFVLGLFGLGIGVRSHAGLIEIIAGVKRSVAAVGTYNALQNPRFGFRGTGFVAGEGNLLVTNAHVLPPPAMDGIKTGLALQFVNETGAPDMRTAVVAALDTAHDLALLRFDGRPLPALTIASPTSIREGLSIALIGFPIGGALGFTPVTHRGIIASITAIAPPMPGAQYLTEKAVRRLREGSFDIYQLDATAYPGNSGGPVLDAETGEVVGVVNMVFVKGSKESALSQPSGITFAIPARFVDELIRPR